MADFYQAQQFVKGREGGYQDMPEDTGNYTDGQLIGTNWGISADTLASHYGYTPSKQQMMDLEYQTALHIYKTRYWDRIDGDNIKNQSVALLIYDGSVNHGVGAMRSVVSKALKENGVNATTSNVFTAPLTRELNKLDQQALFNSIWKGREARYLKGNARFRQGHLNRINKIKFEKRRKKTALIIGISLVSLALLGVGYIIYATLPTDK